MPLEDLHADPAAYRLVFVNGRFSASRSRLPGAETSFSVQRLSALNDGVLEPAARRMAETAGRTEEPFALINSALAEEGVVITIPDHMAVLVPLEILHYVDGDGIALHPRVVMIVGEQSEALLIESYAGKIQVESEPHVGTKIKIILPCREYGAKGNAGAADCA